MLGIPEMTEGTRRLPSPGIQSAAVPGELKVQIEDYASFIPSACVLGFGTQP